MKVGGGGMDSELVRLPVNLRLQASCLLPLEIS